MEDLTIYQKMAKLQALHNAITVARQELLTHKTADHAVCLQLLERQAKALRATFPKPQRVA